MAGLYKFWISTNLAFVNNVPMTVAIPIYKIVLVPIDHSAVSTLPMMLSMPAPIKAPARGVAGIPVFRAKASKMQPVIRL